MNKIPSVILVILGFLLIIVSLALLFSIPEIWSIKHSHRYNWFEKCVLTTIGMAFSGIGLLTAGFAIKHRKI
jgi:uncharacterized BrkB/YihY/UPF0761 family membrane protein